MTGWCPHKTGTLEEQECHFDGYCSECPHNKSDLISRQAAIAAMAELQGKASTKAELKGISKAWKRIKLLPSAQPEQRWIPCSERLPEKEGAYLTCGERGYIYILEYAEGWNCFRNYDGIVERDCEIKDVIAWQPLPEPYQQI